ncbi:MAG: hypothetical protein WBN42_13195, partial [Ignavibacteriaceae bacterium]
MNKKTKSLLIALFILVMLLIILLPKLISSGDNNDAAQNPGRGKMEFPVTAHIVTYEKLSNN